MEDKRMVYMDFLKGIAISMVIIVHFVSRLPELSAVIYYPGLYGQMGCQLFFVVSAYFVCMSLKTRGYTVSFFSKKLLRLMPAYILAIFIHIPVIILMRDYLGIEMNWPRTDLANILANIFFVQHLGGIGGFNVLVTGSWYVFCLIIFYFVFYFAAKYALITARNICMVIAVSVLAECVVGIVLQQVFGMSCDNNSYYYTSIFVQFPVLLLGVKRYFDDEAGKRENIVILAMLAILFYAVAMFLFFSNYPYVFLIIPFLTGIMFYCVVGLAKRVFERFSIDDNLIVRIFRILGKYSYEIFFMHIYPVSYGTRVVRVLLEARGIHLSGTSLFVILIIPMFVCSLLMAFIFHCVVKFLTKSLERAGKQWKRER